MGDCTTITGTIFGEYASRGQVIPSSRHVFIQARPTTIVKFQRSDSSMNPGLITTLAVALHQLGSRNILRELLTLTFLPGLRSECLVTLVTGPLPPSAAILDPDM